jgi:Sec-independent protein translocase protein TatA
MVLALFESLGGSELVIVGIAALLVFGKRLPEVATQAGKQIAKLRHGLDQSWKETGLDKEINELKEVLPNVAPSELARNASRRFQQRLADKARQEGLDPAAQFEQDSDQDDDMTPTPLMERPNLMHTTGPRPQGGVLPEAGAASSPAPAADAATGQGQHTDKAAG